MKPTTATINQARRELLKITRRWHALNRAYAEIGGRLESLTAQLEETPNVRAVQVRRKGMGRRVHPTPKQWEALENLARQGHTAGAIARAAGVSHASLVAAVQRRYSPETSARDWLEHCREESASTEAKP